MPEVTGAGVHHGHAFGVAGSGDFVVLDRAAGLRDGDHAGVGEGFGAVGEGEESIASCH